MEIDCWQKKYDVEVWQFADSFMMTMIKMIMMMTNSDSDRGEQMIQYSNIIWIVEAKY